MIDPFFQKALSARYSLSRRRLYPSDTLNDFWHYIEIFGEENLRTVTIFGESSTKFSPPYSVSNNENNIKALQFNREKSITAYNI